MAAYRTAARLFPGLHLPLVGMGMEYQRMNNLHLAEQLFEQVGQAALPKRHPLVLLAGTAAHCADGNLRPSATALSSKLTGG